jgi:hypothetical protein
LGYDNSDLDISFVLHFHTYWNNCCCATDLRNSNWQKKIPWLQLIQAMFQAVSGEDALTHLDPLFYFLLQ